LRKNNQIAVLAFMGFTMVQVSKATGIYPIRPLRAGVDTTIVTDSSKTIAVENPKAGFTNLFTTAVGGDDASGARLNPMAISFVQEYIRKNEKGFLKMKEWAKPYLGMMDDVLEQHGLPKELKYLAVIESGLKYNAISWAGAVGPWAFMPSAAKEYGLKMGKNDERLDYYKSTHAAARLLTDLYQRYGDWLMVIAAYNCGPGNVDKAIRKSGGSKDFWEIQYNLPSESMNHVKKFIATHYIFEGEGGVTTLTKDETKDLMLGTVSLNEEEMKNSVAHMITGRFNSGVILKHINMPKASFDSYNPNFDNKIAVEGKYELRLPVQKMNIFVQKRYEILDESMQVLLNGATSYTR
jgi:membrane-bound lytic murein transglycosylase D